MSQTILQDPQEKLDYTVDWATDLGVDTIATSTWSVSPSGPVLSDASNTTTAATVWVTGVVQDIVYRLANKIVTAAGREIERTIYIKGWHQ